MDTLTNEEKSALIFFCQLLRDKYKANIDWLNALPPNIRPVDSILKERSIAWGVCALGTSFSISPQWRKSGFCLNINLSEVNHLFSKHISHHYAKYSSEGIYQGHHDRAFWGKIPLLCFTKQEIVEALQLRENILTQEIHKLTEN